MWLRRVLRHRVLRWYSPLYLPHPLLCFFRPFVWFSQKSDDEYCCVQMSLSLYHINPGPLWLNCFWFGSVRSAILAIDGTYDANAKSIEYDFPFSSVLVSWIVCFCVCVCSDHPILCPMACLASQVTFTIPGKKNVVLRFTAAHTMS